MATYYVSKTATNGYVVGNDSNNGTAKSTPYLTITKALSVVANSGDTVTVNPGSSTDIFAEDHSTLGIDLKNNATLTSITFQGDPTYLPNRPTLRGLTASSSSRVVNVPASTAAITISNFIMDGENARNILVSGAMTVVGLTVTNVSFINTTSSFNCVQFSGTSNIGTFTSCTWDATTDHAFAAGDFTTLLISGGSCASVIGMHATSFPNTNALTSYHCTGVTFTGCTPQALLFRGVGVIGTIEVDSCTFTNCKSGMFFTATTPVTSCAHVLFHGNTVGGTFTSQNAGVVMMNVTCSDIKVYGNTCTADGGLVDIESNLSSNIKVYSNTVTLGSSAIRSIQVGPCSTGVEIYSNTVTNAAGSILMVCLGANGYLTDSSNTVSSGTQNFSDVSGNTYVEQAFTTSALTVAGRSSWLAGINVSILKQGSPSGNITCALYADSAGVVTGSALATADVAAASILTGSAQSVYFQFSTPYSMTAATKYHLVFSFSGAVSGSNYIQFQRNTTVTNGYLSVNTLGPGNAWTADSTHAILYTILTGCFGSTDGLVYNNTCTATNTSPTNAIHGVIVGCVSGATVYGNLITNSALGVVVKDAKTCLIKNNAMSTIYSNQGILYDKGSTGCRYYDNTVIGLAGNGSFPVQFGPDPAMGINAPVPSSSTLCKNNIFMASYASGTNYVYSLVANTAGTSPTPTIDYNVVYNGTNTQISSVYTTWATWKASSITPDAHSVNSDPLLTNEATPTTFADYTPASSSPAIFLGTNLLASVAVDANGAARNAMDTAGAVVYRAATNDFICSTTDTLAFVQVRAINVSGSNAATIENVTTKALENYTSANYSSYAINLGEQGSSNVHVGSMPPWMAAGWYCATYFSCSGTPVEGSDTLVSNVPGGTRFYWNGTAQYLPPLTNTSGYTTASSVQGNVTGSVASVAGNVGGNVVGSVASVAGNVSGNVVGTVASVVGNVGGNVVGSVASVAGAVGSVAGNVGGSVASVVGNIGGNVVGSVGSVTGNVGGSVATVTDKSGYSLSVVGQPFSSGTVASAASPSGFRGNAELSSSNDFYVGQAIAFTSTTDPTFKGQSRICSAYLGATRSFTFANAFPTSPTVGDSFDIIGGNG